MVNFWENYLFYQEEEIKHINFAIKKKKEINMVNSHLNNVISQRFSINYIFSNLKNKYSKTSNILNQLNKLFFKLGLYFKFLI